MMKTSHYLCSAAVCLLQSVAAAAQLQPGEAARVTQTLTARSNIQFQVPQELQGPENQEAVVLNESSRNIGIRNFTLVRQDQGAAPVIRVAYEAVPPAMLIPLESEVVSDINAGYQGRTYEINCGTGVVTRVDDEVPVGAEATQIATECMDYTTLFRFAAIDPGIAPVILTGPELEASLPAVLECLGIRQMQLTPQAMAEGNARMFDVSAGATLHLMEQDNHLVYTGAVQVEASGSFQLDLATQSNLRFTTRDGPALTGTAMGTLRLTQQVERIP